MIRVIFVFFVFLNSLLSNSLDEIRNSGVVRIGVDIDLPPFSKLVDGNFEGFEIELAQAIAKDIFGDKKGEIEFVPTAFRDGFNYLKDNKIDIFFNVITITDERLKIVDFSMPYLSVSTAILTRTSDNIEKLGDLQGKKIIALDGTIAQNEFRKKGYEVVSCLNSGECYMMLKNGKGDGFADDNINVLGYPLLDREVEVVINSVGKADFVGIAVAKGNKTLLDYINQQLINLSRDDFFKNIFEENMNVFYKGTVDRKHFLLDDIYRIFG